ncbi:MAG TPA: hypothetical protein VIK81_04530 [Patescibacteria group bacterium]
MLEIYKQPVVEVEYSPLRQDKTEKIPFVESEIALRKASEKINSIWNAYLSAGISSHVLISEILKRPEIVEITVGSTSINYKVESLGQKTDGLGQRVDIIRLLRDKEMDLESASSIIFATGTDNVNRFRKLVSLIIEDEGKNLTKQQFHFVNGELRIIFQVSQPGVLFSTPYTENEKQFFSVSIGSLEDKSRLLRVVAGLNYDDPINFYWYKNYGGDLVETQKIRTTQGEIELVEVTKKGFFATPPVYLPDAIVNMANFDPATAT